MTQSWTSGYVADIAYIEGFYVQQSPARMALGCLFGNVAADAFRPIEAGEPDANGRVQVATAIEREGQPDVSMEYLLQKNAQGDWRIINIVADGVSDLALKRAEYQRVFASGGIEGLIAELEQQTHRLGRG